MTQYGTGVLKLAREGNVQFCHWKMLWILIIFRDGNINNLVNLAYTRAVAVSSRGRVLHHTERNEDVLCFGGKGCWPVLSLKVISLSVPKISVLWLFVFYLKKSSGVIKFDVGA